MKKKYVGTLIVSLLVLGTVFGSGCLLFPGGSHPTKYIHDVFMSMHIDYDEVANINYTYVEEYFKSKGAGVTTYLDESYEPKTAEYGFNVYNYANTESPGIADISIFARTRENGTKYAMYHFIFYPDSKHDDSDDVEYIKEYIKESANGVADICNLTLNWDNAKWTVNYSD